MRRIQRHPFLRFLVALVGSGILSWGIWQWGRLAMLIALLGLLTVLLFGALTIAVDCTETNGDLAV